MRRSAAGLIAIFFTMAAQGQEYPKITDRLASQSQVEALRSGLGLVDPTGARPISNIALELIKLFEGWVADAYDDPAGYCTIGYGHLVALQRCGTFNLGKYSRPLTPSEGSSLLEEDTASARLAVQALVTVQLNQNQFGALSSFVFNIGKTGFAKSDLLKLINANKFDLAAGEFGRWVKAGGQRLEGLVARRSCERGLFVGRLQFNATGKLSRSDCAGLGIAEDAQDLLDITTGEP
jgi:lysozyme